MGLPPLPGDMTLLSKLRSFLGLGDDASRQTGTTVRVEREPDAASERAVKEPVSDEPTAGSDRGSDPADSDRAGESVDSLSGIGPAYADRLADAGIETVGDLAAADPVALDAATDLGEGRIAGWIEQARDA